MLKRKPSPEKIYSQAHFSEEPDAKTLKFVQMDKGHRQAADWRLRERGDAYESLFAKLFPKDKGNTALMRLLTEQATKLDMLLRELVKRGKAESIEKALEMLQKDDPDVVNPPSRERMDKEERVRGAVLKVAYALQNSKWEKAAALLKAFEKKADRDLVPVFHEELTPILRKVFADLLDKKDPKSMHDFTGAVFYLFNIAGLKGISLGDLPARAAEHQELLKSIQGSFLYAIAHPNYFGAIRTGWRNFGVDTKPIEREPAFFARVQKYPPSQFGNGQYPTSYQITRDGFLHNDILSKEEVEQQRRAEIIPKAQKYLLSRFKIGGYGILYKLTVEDYLRCGILTKDETEQHRRAEIVPIARKFLLDRLGEGEHPALYVAMKESFVLYGILTAQEAESINRSPEVQAYLRKGI